MNFISLKKSIKGMQTQFAALWWMGTGLCLVCLFLAVERVLFQYAVSFDTGIENIDSKELLFLFATLGLLMAVFSFFVAMRQRRSMRHLREYTGGMFHTYFSGNTIAREIVETLAKKVWELSDQKRNLLEQHPVQDSWDEATRKTAIELDKKMTEAYGAFNNFVVNCTEAGVEVDGELMSYQHHSTQSLPQKEEPTVDADANPVATQAGPVSQAEGSSRQTSSGRRRGTPKKTPALKGGGSRAKTTSPQPPTQTGGAGNSSPGKGGNNAAPAAKAENSSASTPGNGAKTASPKSPTQTGDGGNSNSGKGESVPTPTTQFIPVSQAADSPAPTPTPNPTSAPAGEGAPVTVMGA